MQGSLLDIVDHLDEVDKSDHYASPCLFAVGGPEATPTARALVSPGDEAGSFVCPEDASLSYVFMVQQAKEAIEVWSAWRAGRKPTPADKFAAVMYYSQHDAFLPVDQSR